VGVVSTHRKGVRRIVKVSPSNRSFEAFSEPIKMQRNLTAARIEEATEMPMYMVR
jgi:hypothetical protein